MNKFKLNIQKSSNSFGDQFVTVYLIGPNGTEMFNYHNSEGSWMSLNEIVDCVARDAGISKVTIRKAVQNETL